MADILDGMRITDKWSMRLILKMVSLMGSGLIGIRMVRLKLKKTIKMVSKMESGSLGLRIVR